MSNWAECKEHYQQALKAAHKDQRQHSQNGTYPYLQILDEILPDYQTAGEVNLGLIDIPIDKIVGTKTKGRTTAFSANFMPLLSEDSEFGLKWRNLCSAHLSDAGIRDPITCFEFLGRFYVQEGNKRVSVLKYFGSTSVFGNVIRILPAESSRPEVIAYRDFLTYYPMTKLYEVAFSKEGCFPKLQAALGYDRDHVWTDEERKRFQSSHFYFSQAFQKLGGDELPITTADAMLEWLKVYPFSQIRDMSAQNLERSLEAMWPEIKTIGSQNRIEVHTQDLDTDETTYKNRRSFSLMPSYLNVAFIHELKQEESNWVRAHEEGSRHLEEILGDQVIVQRFFGVGTGEMAERAMEIAIKNGAEILFATTASLITACRRVAARHPETRIFNCSVYMPYSDVRTYYSRIYEGKFISGAIAGAISKSDRIGYIASYPIFGVPAGINAFALGVQLTNPRARVELKWSCVPGDPLAELKEQGIDTVSTLDIPMPGWEQGNWGTFQIKPDGNTELLASPYWDWGAFYVKLAQSILGGDWDALNTNRHGIQAVNYWWGMASGVIGIEMTKALPAGVEVLAQMLKRDIVNGSIDPFYRQITSQDGVERNDGHTYFTPDQLLRMDWLCDNVDGAIPAYEELSAKSQKIVRLQGIYRDTIPPEKEGVLL